MSEPVNRVRMVVDLRFEGTYWRPEELVDVASDWIDGGLYDRDDLSEWHVSGEVLQTSTDQKIGRPLAVGDVIHGFASGAFGRDHYRCTRVESVGKDWIVARNALGAVECLSGHENLHYAQVARDAGREESCDENPDLCVGDE